MFTVLKKTGVRIGWTFHVRARDQIGPSSLYNTVRPISVDWYSLSCFGNPANLWKINLKNISQVANHERLPLPISSDRHKGARHVHWIHKCKYVKQSVPESSKKSIIINGAMSYVYWQGFVYRYTYIDIVL